MRKAWVAFAAALTIGAAALTMSTPARAQCAAPVLAGGGCCGSYEPRGLFTSGGYGCGGYGYGGCGSCGCNGAGYSGTQPYYPEGYSHGRGYGYSGGGYYGRGSTARLLRRRLLPSPCDGLRRRAPSCPPHLPARVSVLLRARRRTRHRGARGLGQGRGPVGDGGLSAVARRAKADGLRANKKPAPQGAGAARYGIISLAASRCQGRLAVF